MQMLGIPTKVLALEVIDSSWLAFFLISSLEQEPQFWVSSQGPGLQLKQQGSGQGAAQTQSVSLGSGASAWHHGCTACSSNRPASLGHSCKLPGGRRRLPTAVSRGATSCTAGDPSLARFPAAAGQAGSGTLFPGEAKEEFPAPEPAASALLTPASALP